MSQDKRRTKMKKEIFKKSRHALWALYLPIYLIAFFMLEHYIGWDADYWVSYTPLDDVIPFCEYFVIFYYLWYPFMGAVGIWLIFEDGDKFRRYMWFIAIGFSASVVFMALFPNGQNLRPESFAHDNIFTRMVGAMYKIKIRMFYRVSMWSVPLPPISVFATAGSEKKYGSIYRGLCLLY